MSKKEQVESLYNQFREYTETAEQHEFPYLVQVHFYIEMGYNDLKEHWDEKHADIFISSVADLLVKLGNKELKK